MIKWKNVKKLCAGVLVAATVMQGMPMEPIMAEIVVVDGAKEVLLYDAMGDNDLNGDELVDLSKNTGLNCVQISNDTKTKLIGANKRIQVEKVSREEFMGAFEY